jgi:methylase of polypeptide subunit release factors
LPDLLSFLESCGYEFVTPTPATQRRVLSRPDKLAARGLRDFFGWNLPAEASLLPDRIIESLKVSGALRREQDGRLRSRVRVARLCGDLFLHSAFPTDDDRSVFLGPDSYRFANLLMRELANVEGEPRLVDFGTGAGVGGIVAARQIHPSRVTLLDTNPLALRLAAINAAHAGLEVELIEGSSLSEVLGNVDVVIANPPFMIDSDQRTYRSGGDLHGARVSLDWSLAAAERLTPGGRMILYTGAAIVDGADALRTALEAELPRLGCSVRYQELDPDIFGEELSRPGYAQVERIAAVAAVIRKEA